MTSTKILFFDKVHVKQVCVTSTTNTVNECNVLLQRNEEGKVEVKRGVYETNNQPKKATFKYYQEGRLCLGVDKLEIKDGIIIGKRCPLFDYTEKKFFTIDAYKK